MKELSFSINIIDVIDHLKLLIIYLPIKPLLW
jgi:hypothetical protein